MGKGDQRSKKGKIIAGTYGVNRPKSGNKKKYTPEAGKQEGA